MYDVAIIGGGVIGCAIARELSRYRLRTIVLEMCEEVGFGTTKTNSGIIHAGHHSSPDTLKGRLVVRGNQLFDELFEELNFGFARIGELVVAREQKDLTVLENLRNQGEATKTAFACSASRACGAKSPICPTNLSPPCTPRRQA